MAQTKTPRAMIGGVEVLGLEAHMGGVAGSYICRLSHDLDVVLVPKRFGLWEVTLHDANQSPTITVCSAKEAAGFVKGFRAAHGQRV
jgi:hypothetical protein